MQKHGGPLCNTNHQLYLPVMRAGMMAISAVNHRVYKPKVANWTF